QQGPGRAVRDPEGDDPDREPDRDPQDVEEQGRRGCVPQLPAHAESAEDLRRQRLPAGAHFDAQELQVPGTPLALYDQESRRLGFRRQAVLRSEDRDRHQDPEGDRLSTPAVSIPAPRVSRGPGGAIAQGLATAYLSLIVLLPLSALVWHAAGGGLDDFRAAITDPQAVAALKLTLVASAAVALINAVMGTIVAWILVRDRFPGHSVVTALVDLPFALPPIVAGLMLLTLYGPTSRVRVDVAFSRWAVLVSLLFVTLP